MSSEEKEIGKAIDAALIRCDVSEYRHLPESEKIGLRIMAAEVEARKMIKEEGYTLDGMKKMMLICADKGHFCGAQGIKNVIEKMEQS